MFAVRYGICGNPKIIFPTVSAIAMSKHAVPRMDSQLQTVLTRTSPSLSQAWTY